ncbi:MAG: hypothetical protein ACRDKA_03780 [Actinomycetota bacterium]
MLAERARVVAPDLPGFGYTPPAGRSAFAPPRPGSTGSCTRSRGRRPSWSATRWAA